MKISLRLKALQVIRGLRRGFLEADLSIGGLRLAQEQRADLRRHLFEPSQPAELHGHGVFAAEEGLERRREVLEVLPG